jgi:3-oxoacyl-[acyl-carrier protein] reductase
MINSYDFQGQTAVVTGGASGIGAAIAERLAVSGARVAIWDRDVSKLDPSLITIPPDRRLTIELDVTDVAAVERATVQTVEALGEIDVLVANAGIAGNTSLLWEYDPAMWRKINEVNLDGVFLCCRAIVPRMIVRNYGRIVTIASVAGKEGNPQASAYSASKAGVMVLTKSLGKELAEFDIGVNAITPGIIDTPILSQVSQEHRYYVLSKVPRKRYGRLEEIASLCAFIASRENSFTTGAIFDFTGGRATY